MNLLHPAELRILYVWVEAAITIEIVGARELNFSTQEKMSHTPTQNTASLVARCRWRNGHLLRLCFISPSNTAGRGWEAKGNNSLKNINRRQKSFNFN